MVVMSSPSGSSNTDRHSYNGVQRFHDMDLIIDTCTVGEGTDDGPGFPA